MQPSLVFPRILQKSLSQSSYYEEKQKALQTSSHVQVWEQDTTCIQQTKKLKQN